MIKGLLFSLSIGLSIVCEGQQSFDIDHIAKEFYKRSALIHTIEYSMQKIDSFPGGPVWNIRGVALIEKNKAENLGFSFFGKQQGDNMEYIYDNGVGFIVNDSASTYEMARGGSWFLGSPGGQTVVKNLFYLDSIYKSRSLAISQNALTITYKLNDDTIHDVTNIVKSIELSRETYLPTRIVRTANAQGKRTFTLTILSNVRINDQVTNSIHAKKDALKNYTIVHRPPDKPNPVLGTQFPVLTLFDLKRPTKAISLPSGMPILIDFWENWCGPCIASLPEVERLHRKYSGQLRVVGIIFQNSDEALRLADKKKITFQNAIGHNEIKKIFTINSWPRYFLFDKNGMVVKEYFKYSEKIESDIKQLIE